MRREYLALTILAILGLATLHSVAQFPSSAPNAGGGGGSTNAAGADTEVQFNDGGTAFGANSGMSYNKATHILTLSGGITTGNGTDPGLDDDLCGTAPSSPSAGHVYGYCTSKIPLWKNEDGTVFQVPQQGFPIAQNSKSAAYTTVLSDCGGSIYHPSADTTARTWTIDSNANVAAPIGCTITFVNDTSAGVITLAITSDTLVLAVSGSTGSRTIAASCIATATKMTSTRWMISGGSCLT